MFSPHLFNKGPEIPATETKQENKVKVIQIGMEEITLSLSADDIIISV